MIIVGINSFFEHPAVAVIAGGDVLFAVEDERFTGIKHGRKYSPHRTYLPVDALYAALKGCGFTAADVNEIAYSYNRWDHLRSLSNCFTGRGLSSFREVMTAFSSLINVREALSRGYEIPVRYGAVLDSATLGRIDYREWNHHRSHAASSFFCSGFDESLVVVCDGAGEHTATSVYVGRGRELLPIANAKMPHSLGILYSMVTKHLGFEPFGDEFKVMGLAAYGEPLYADAFRQLVRLDAEGAYHVDLRALWNLEHLLGPARPPDTELEQRHRDIARSVQERLEQALEHVVAHHLQTTGLRRLCLAGGTFMNCVVNGRLARLSRIDDIFVQPASHDAGTAIGAAALSWIRRGGAPQLQFSSAALGTEYSDDEVACFLNRAGVRYHPLADDELITEIASRLAAGQIGGIFRGRMEFGSRALGMRSVLASPLDADMRDRLNLLKSREEFRPVAPIVTAEAFTRFFDGYSSRYMSFTSFARDEAKRVIPSAVHIDGTARVQTVWEHHDAFLHALLCRFETLTGVPVLINTSLNVCGRPIVESLQEALACLYITQMDFLVLGHFLVEKRPTPESSVADTAGPFHLRSVAN
jgi:carbamoyltransferase